MKILVVSNMFPNEKHPEYGTFVKNFCDQLGTIGIQYDLVKMYKQSTKIKKCIAYLKFYAHSFFTSMLKKYDLIYIHYPSYSAPGVLLAKRINNKLQLYVNLHGSDVVPENMRQKKMEKFTERTIRQSKKIIVPSLYFSEYISKKYAVNKNKIFIYPSGGIDANIFSPQNVDWNEPRTKELVFDYQYKTFGFIGRISKGKGWDVYIKAINQLEKEKIKANFLIVGNGNEKDLMLKMIESYGLNNKIKILGARSQQELSYIYSLIDFLVFPTEREGESLGLVALEAMACGTPVIASDFAAPKYYIKDKINGYKFPKGDWNKLSLLMKNIVLGNTEENYENMKENALITGQKYSREKTINDLKKIFSLN